MFCKYKDALGKPKEGIHSFRVFGFAIIDVGMTVVGAGVLAWFFRWSFWITLLVLFFVGIALHRLFCVRTEVDRLLFR